MKIYIPEISGIGGGHTFTRNFKETVLDKIVNSKYNADIFFITGATLINRNELEGFKGKIVLRVDGVPEDSRNRGTGWPRLKDFAKVASLIIFQSNFVLETVGSLLGVSGEVIYNGVDQTVFKVEGDRFPKFGHPSVLYCNYRKGEQNKRVEEAVERFRYYKLEYPDATMTFVGRFPKHLRDWDFWMLDYERNKDWQVLPPTDDREILAKIMRSCDKIAFPSFADPCPNTLIEAMSCGCDPLWINEYGGQKEIVDNWDKVDWSRERMVQEYISAFERIL